MTLGWRPASVRVRLTLWYVGAVATIVLLYAAIVFGYLRSNLWHALDHQLHEDLEMAEELLIRTSGGEVVWRSPQFDDGHDADRTIEVWDVDGGRRLLLFPEGQSRAALFPRPPVVGTTESYTTLRLSDDARVRALTTRMSVGGAPALARATRSEAPARRALRELAIVLGFALPLALGAAGFGGHFLARRALRPVDLITERARSITADRLDARIPVDNPHDELGRLAIVLNDTLARLDEAFARLKQFTDDASHELRTPLTAMRSVGEVGLQERRDEARYRATIGSMLEEVDRLTRLVDTLLTLARADKGPAALSLESVDISSLVREVSAQLEVLAEEKRQTLRITASDGANASVDRLLLRSAFFNIVDNAIKYSPEQANITIRVEKDPDATRIAVTDNGPGIGEAHQPHIFDRFYRVDKARSRDLGGVGLGLAIAQWAVVANGGRIELRSREGEGSTFTIVLPHVPAGGALPLS